MINFLNYIKSLFFVNETLHVYCGVGTALLIIFKIKSD
jgi:hypothetical protein